MLVGFDDDLAGEATRLSNRIRGLLTGIHPALERAIGPRISHPAVLEILSRCGGPTGSAKAGRRKLTAIESIASNLANPCRRLRINTGPADERPTATPGQVALIAERARLMDRVMMIMVAYGGMWWGCRRRPRPASAPCTCRRWPETPSGATLPVIATMLDGLQRRCEQHGSTDAGDHYLGGSVVKISCSQSAPTTQKRPVGGDHQQAV